MSIVDIMAATGWGESGAAYTASKLSESGLVNVRREGNKNFYFMGNGQDAEPEPVSKGEVMIAPKERKTRIVAAREVELVVAGVLVILGRNPASGRLRIVLEEM